jgi:hypothetical protein
LLSVIGVSAYIIVNKLLPEKVASFEKAPIKDLKHNDAVKLTKQIWKKILKDEALKIAIVFVFATAGI